MPVGRSGSSGGASGGAGAAELQATNQTDLNLLVSVSGFHLDEHGGHVHGQQL